jgi:Aspartyl protease/PDZ domain
MRHISAGVLILLGVFGPSNSSQGQAPPPEVPPNLVLERFAVAENCELLVVPVMVAEKEHLFVVDTGASVTVFDTSLPLGEPFDVLTVDAPGGNVELKLYHSPEAKLGKLPLHPLDAVAGKDLESIRRVSGIPIEGVLGMDFLGRYVVHIDVEKGEFLLLKSAPNSAGEELPISWEPGEVPYVMAEVAPDEPVRFMIDTGMASVDSGTLGVFKIRSLERKGEFRRVGETLAENLSGTSSWRTFQGRALELGRFAVRSPIFCESHGLAPNVLGLGFWSRFAATFDFPERKVYLRKSAHFDRPDRWNATGLHLWKMQGSIEVAAVDPDSPAARAGLRKGDLLVELNRLMADKASLWDFYCALCDGGRLTCVIRRDSKEQRLSIDRGR